MLEKSGEVTTSKKESTGEEPCDW
uniref:Uncharacterized protein n=1 Tax=Rhizophora mucronata TaxID=61149 RepID=A0A2P2NMD6_RHIMU